MIQKGLLIVRTNPPQEFEEEFNDWYDTEHIAERLSVPGFQTARRFVALSRDHRYLALYDVENILVLSSPQYLAVAGDNVTPWTRRVISRGRFVRTPTIQIYPGHVVTTSGSRLLLIALRGVDMCQAADLIAASKENFPENEFVQQLRICCTEDSNIRDFFVIVEGHGLLESMLNPRLFALFSRNLSLVTLYEPYI